MKRVTKGNVNECQRVIVIGSGIAGLCAVIEAAKSPHTSVLLVEKESTLGGNSIKATSGISCTSTSGLSRRHDQELLKNDVLKSSKGRSNIELVDILVQGSKHVIPWLSQFGVNLNQVTKCGGHSVARTHCEKDCTVNIGRRIVDVLVSFIVQQDNIDILFDTRVVKLSKDGTGIYTSCGEFIECNAIVLATGGFSANKSLLKRFKKDEYPTTNGKFATGDGLKLAVEAGGHLVDMDQIQIHPTYFVTHPILAPEAMRGCGGLLVKEDGQRFVNELDTRDAIVKAWPKDSKVYLVMDEQAIEKFGTSFNFYIKKSIFEKTACGGWYVAQVQPAVHYTMGGVVIDKNARVVGTNNIFAAGEVTGGIHGANRLAGNSLLETIVFGRIAGYWATK